MEASLTHIMNIMNLHMSPTWLMYQISSLQHLRDFWTRYKKMQKIFFSAWASATRTTKTHLVSLQDFSATLLGPRTLTFSSSWSLRCRGWRWRIPAWCWPVSVTADPCVLFSFIFLSSAAGAPYPIFSWLTLPIVCSILIYIFLKMEHLVSAFIFSLKLKQNKTKPSGSLVPLLFWLLYWVLLFFYHSSPPQSFPPPPIPQH